MVEYLKSRIPATTSIAGMTPTYVFVAFASWINNTVGAVIEHELQYSKQLLGIVSSYREAHNALPGAMIREKLKGENERAEANR